MFWCAANENPSCRRLPHEGFSFRAMVPLGLYTRSIIVATAIPQPMHMVISPYRP